MMTKWHGPYRIIKVQERPQGRVYTLYNAKKKSERSYHEVFLKPYPTEEGFTDHDALKVSVLDDEMFVMQEIIAHRYEEESGNKELELLILWYGTDEPEWKKYDKRMDTNTLVLRYLQKKGLKTLTREQKKRLLEEDTPEISKKVKFGEEEQDVKN